MIYKVYFQEKGQEVPVRENTKAIYLEADSEKDVRLALKSREYNIEFIQLLQGSYLDYEKQQEYFTVESL